MKRDAAVTLARLAALGALVGLSLLVWSLVGPLLAVLLFMSVGQLVGIASLALYCAAVVVDLRRARVLAPRRAEGESTS